MKHTASLTPMQPPAPRATTEQLETFLRTTVAGVEEEAAPDPHTVGRPLEVSNGALWSALLVCLLRGLRSQKAVWRELAPGAVVGVLPCPGDGASDLQAAG